MSGLTNKIILITSGTSGIGLAEIGMSVSTSGDGKWSAGAFEPVGPVSPPKRVTPRRVNTAPHKGV